MQKRAIIIIISVITMLSSIDVFAQDGLSISPKLAADIDGKHNTTINGATIKSSANAGFSLSTEVTYTFYEYVSLGLGATVMLPRKDNSPGSGEFEYLPVYGIVKLNAPELYSVNTSLVFQMGQKSVLKFKGNTDFTDGYNLAGDKYWGAGVRFSLSKIFFEGLYKKYYGIGTVSTSQKKYEYSTISIGFGIIFSGLQN